VRLIVRGLIDADPFARVESKKEKRQKVSDVLIRGLGAADPALLAG
jgi:hypothetical protein